MGWKNHIIINTFFILTPCFTKGPARKMRKNEENAKKCTPHPLPPPPPDFGKAIWLGRKCWVSVES